MGGGSLQLAAKSAQDIYLTGNPQITLFKAVYRRHTNFARETIEQTFNETPGTGENILNSIIDKTASYDLLSGLHLKFSFPAINHTFATTASTYFNYTNNTGHAYIKNAEFFMGSSLIDSQDGTWLDIYNELTDKNEDQYTMLNKHKNKNGYLKGNSSTTTPADVVYVPLQFWFCRNPGLALPLCSLQYQNIKFRLTTRSMAGMLNTDGVASSTSLSTAPTIQLFADYIFLDTDERRRFSTIKHEYLIEQVQKTSNLSISSANFDASLPFSHPVKSLFWVIRHTTSNTEASGLDVVTDATANVSGSAMTGRNDYFNYMASFTTNSEAIGGVVGYEPFATGTVKFGSEERFTAQNASYFRLVEPNKANMRVPEKHVYMYSFSLQPNEYQPSGSANFSRIDNAKLSLTGCSTSNNNLTVYALNYNVIRILNGKGGLGYAS